MATEKQIEASLAKAMKKQLADRKKYDKPLKPKEKQLPIESYIEELPLGVPEDSIDWDNHILSWAMPAMLSDDHNEFYYMEFDFDTRFLSWTSENNNDTARYRKRIHNTFRFKMAMKDWKTMVNWGWQYNKIK